MKKICSKIVSCLTAAAITFTVLVNTISVEVSSLTTTEQCALVATAFAMDKDSDVNSVNLQWASENSVSTYTLYRTQGAESQFVKIYEGSNTSYQDVDLPLGDWYHKLVMDNSTQSKIVKVTTYEMPDNLLTYDNVSGSSLKSNNEIYSNGVYYSYRYVSDSDGMNRIDEYTSTDGTNYSFSKTVLDKYSHSDLNSCKLEALNFKYSKEQNKVILWAHWELKSGYGSGKALVATAVPGENFTVHNVFNPCNVEVRDMNLFIDDDQKGYLVAASNLSGQGANRTLYIFELTSDYTNVSRVVQTLFDNQYREAPALIKQDGYYYLFTSQAAGWYPSNGMYASASSIDGTWSDLRDIGNLTTFSCQSGGISVIGSGENTKYIMMANRWIRGDGTASQVALPISMSNGYAFYDYWTELLYNPSTGDLIPYQDGQLLSQGKTATASLSSASGYDAGKAVDGNYNTAYKASSSTWPFWWQVDLGETCDLSNIQISWYICKGSEGYYKYQIQTSNDGYNWTTIHYNTDTSDTKVSKTYGFNVNDLSGSGRYVRIYVENAVLHNNNSNWYTPMVYEIKVFGQSQAAAYNKLKNYYEQCKNFSGDLYTEESYNYFADILSQAKSLIDNSYASSSQYEAMYASLQDAVSKLEINSDAIVEVTGTVAPAAVCVNQMPDLPDTIEVKTYNGQIKQAEISWQNLSESRFTVPYSTVKVDGTITGTSIGVFGKR